MRIRRNLIDVAKKSFSDKKYGGPELSKEAAIKHRDLLIKTLPPFQLYVGPSPKSNSGYYGVLTVKGGYRGYIKTSS